MIPGLAFGSPFAWLLTLVGLAGGMIIWGQVASHAGVWGRMIYQAGDVWRLLLVQTAIVTAVMVGLMIIGGLLGNTLGAPARLFATIAGVLFWGYVGALILTAARGTMVKK